MINYKDNIISIKKFNGEKFVCVCSPLDNRNGEYYYIIDHNGHCINICDLTTIVITPLSWKKTAPLIYNKLKKIGYKEA